MHAQNQPPQFGRPLTCAPQAPPKPPSFHLTSQMKTDPAHLRSGLTRPHMHATSVSRPTATLATASSSLDGVSPPSSSTVLIGKSIRTPWCSTFDITNPNYHPRSTSRSQPNTTPQSAFASAKASADSVPTDHFHSTPKKYERGVASAPSSQCFAFSLKPFLQRAG
jgi:hypothetical protein